MLTLSFIHNFAPRKIKPKTMDRKTKAFTGKLSCSSPSSIQFSSKEAPPTRKPCVQKFSTKKLYAEEIMSASAVPNEVTRCVDIYEQNNLNFDPSIIKLQA